MNILARRVLGSLIGTLIVGFGAGLIKLAALGTDPYMTLVVGFSNITTIPYATIYPIVNIVTLVVIFFLDRRLIGIGTIFNVFLIGLLVDFTTGLIQPMLSAQGGLVQSIVLFTAALPILCFGAAMTMAANVGVSSYDAVAIIMTDKKIAPFKVNRIITDIICTVFGFFNGADVGVGTAITALMLGPIVQFFLDHVVYKFIPKTTKGEV